MTTVAMMPTMTMVSMMLIMTTHAQCQWCPHYPLQPWHQWWPHDHGAHNSHLDHDDHSGHGTWNDHSGRSAHDDHDANDDHSEHTVHNAYDHHSDWGSHCACNDSAYFIYSCFCFSFLASTLHISLYISTTLPNIISELCLKNKSTQEIPNKKTIGYLRIICKWGFRTNQMYISFRDEKNTGDWSCNMHCNHSIVTMIQHTSLWTYRIAFPKSITFILISSPEHQHKCFLVLPCTVSLVQWHQIEA